MEGERMRERAQTVIVSSVDCGQESLP